MRPDTRCTLLLDADLQAVLCRHFVWGDFQRYVQSHCNLVQQQVLPNADQHRNADHTHEHYVDPVVVKKGKILVIRILLVTVLS